MKKFYLLLTVFFLSITSCTEKLSPAEYIHWVEEQENGLKISQSTEQVSYILQYEPAAYKALKTIQSQSAFNTKFNKKKKQFASLHHFLLKIKPNRISVSEEKLPKYLAYQLEDKIEFISGKDTLDRTVMYHLESSVGVTPYYRILLAYPQNHSSQDIELIINRNKLDKRKVKFRISGSDLSDIPSIKLNNKKGNV